VKENNKLNEYGEIRLRSSQLLKKWKWSFKKVKKRH